MKLKMFNEPWIEAKGCEQPKVFIGDKQPNGWRAGLVRLSRCEAKTLVDQIIGHSKGNYHRHQTGRTVNPDYRFSGGKIDATTYIPYKCESVSKIGGRIPGTQFIDVPCCKAEDIREILQFRGKMIG